MLPAKSLCGSASVLAEKGKLALQKDEETKMAMPQRDDWIEEIKRLDALLEYAVMHGDEAEAERLRAARRKLTEAF